MGGGDAGGDAGGAAASAPDAPETQEQKRTAAEAYDYEGDARWADYWSNVLVPPHLAAKPEVVAHFRGKFYHRFVDRDLVVEPMASTGSTPPSRPDVRSSPPASSEGVRGLGRTVQVLVPGRLPHHHHRQTRLRTHCVLMHGLYFFP
ncbi:uncharacterized protein [Lolium perenne]|uniref:uncharacterized protein isoform X2 n=1 Tax=Lolium perenne TaxID=4522 RepID=UPI0021F565E0|nr:uncharacterized protein LOC127314542 isoform X3 [Lolium perenne]